MFLMFSGAIERHHWHKMGYEKMSPQQVSYKRSLGVSQGFRKILKTVQRGMEKLSVLSFY